MADSGIEPVVAHSHVFLGSGHESAERRSRAVIWLCAAMMVLEIGGGLVFGSIALVADGLHMSTHAGALLLAAMAYYYARKHAEDPRFTFGTGKFGDLAGFTSAIVLAMISLLIGYEALLRLFSPVPIQFGEAIPIACLGLAVNIGSVWLLSGGGHDHHHHGHGHGHGHHHADHGDRHVVKAAGRHLEISIFEDGVPPRFRIEVSGAPLDAPPSIETLREDGSRQSFATADRGAYFESVEEIPEPHAFDALIGFDGETRRVVFEEHMHADSRTGRDNNMRAAIVHVIADAMVSVLVILGLVLAKTFGWLWMDPVAGLIGAAVIASWALALVRDTGAILLDMNPDQAMTSKLREAIEAKGDRLADLHLWRLGPGHLGAIVSIVTPHGRDVDFYQSCLSRFRGLSHVTIEIQKPL